MLPIAVKAGQRSLSRGADDEVRGGYTGEIMISKYLPDYAQSILDGQAFEAANQAAQAVSAALATTYTGLLLYNPVGSDVLIIPKMVKFALSVAPAAIAPIGLLAGSQTVAPTGLTAVAVQNGQVGNAGVGRGLAYSAATILTPVWRKLLWDGFTAAALPAPQVPVDLRGDIVIKPGSFIGIAALTAVTGLGSISWVEVPLAS